MSITLYDIPSTAPGRAISCNTFKARVSLAFKGLSFKTEWLEMPDIEPKLKEIGAEPTPSGKNGSLQYTVPVIHDHTTGRVVSESMCIARYLDETYPDKPTLFPLGAYAPIAKFDAYFFPTAIAPGSELLSYGSVNHISATSKEFMLKTRDKEYLARALELTPSNPKRAPYLAALKEGFGKISNLLSANGEGQPFYYGKTMSYADVIIVAHLLWMRAALEVDSPEWKEIEGWDDGRWKQLLEATKQYHGLEFEK